MSKMLNDDEPGIVGAGAGPRRGTMTHCEGRCRVSTTLAANMLGASERTLEDWRSAWHRAAQEGKPELRRGPKFYVVGKRVLYEVRDLEAFAASRPPRAALRGRVHRPSSHPTPG